MLGGDSQFTLGICCAHSFQSWSLHSGSFVKWPALFPKLSTPESAGFTPDTPSLGRMGEGTIVLEVLVIFEILKKSKLGTVGLWENSVSSITGDVCYRFSTYLCA